jgi:hypothetical protein
MALFAFAAIGSASEGRLQVTSRSYLRLPSASLPAGRLNQMASGYLLLADLRVNVLPFHSTTDPPSESSLRTVAPMLDQSNLRILAQGALVVRGRVG